MRRYKVISLYLLCVLAGSASITAGKKIATAFEPVNELPEGKAIVYIYRPNDGISQVYNIRANGESLVNLRPGSYFPFVCDPGATEFTAKVKFKFGSTGLLDKAWSAEKMTRLDIKAGQVYYLKGVPNDPLAFTQRMELIELDPEQAIAEIQHTHLALRN